MAQLIERGTGGTVDSQLIPEEVERLRELGVEVEQSDNDGSGSGGGEDAGEEAEEESDEGSGSGGDESSKEESPEEEGDGSGSGEDDGDESDDLDMDNSGVDVDDVEEIEQQSELAGEEGGPEPDDLDEQVAAAEAAGAGSGNIKMDNFESYDYESEWESIGSRYGNQLAGMLVDHFRQERMTDIKRGQRSGRFDSRRLIEADRGSPKVFKSEDNPDEKKYHAVICMDDSGSMGGHGDSRLKQACITTGMLVQALEEAGIETTVYRFARNVRLVKTSAQSYEETKDAIYERLTYGGTALLPAIKQAQEIAAGHADETFLVTITDGKPSHSDQIIELLEQSHMTSITIQIERSDELFRGAYDGWVYSEGTGELPSKTQSAFRRVML